MTIHDITPAITEGFAVWPGDTPPSREVLLDIAHGNTVTLSTLRATVHLGAHADAPSHYGADAPAIHERSLDSYIGPCQVVTARAALGTRVRPEDIDAEITAERVLIRTETVPDPSVFREDFAALSPELIEAFHARGVRTIGIDTPSVDLFESKDLPAHKTFLRLDMAILEGITLKGVPDGAYELIALPLKLVGFDASPVRAVLRPVG
ncbi:MAG: kynurenine formamidase [Phycisphaeraceae bacterium]|nr:MAG: kynurenine formamidase [Phycisphaeraceae bacterium]